jgi:hypothetical protein
MVTIKKARLPPVMSSEGVFLCIFYKLTTMKKEKYEEVQLRLLKEVKKKT